MDKKRPAVLPVIHHLDADTTLDEILVARACGADGAFLISHDNADAELLEVARRAIRESDGFPIGLNLLSVPCTQAVQMAMDVGSMMVWADDMGVDSKGLKSEGLELSALVRANPLLTLFASVAFKYRPHEADPVGAAAHARAAGFVPTTSGDATGHAPAISKIEAMGAGGALAIASGMTPANVGPYARALTHILVATGVARSEHHIDPSKLRALIDQVRAAT
jgi:predicted TIM-barrel enzyme